MDRHRVPEALADDEAHVPSGLGLGEVWVCDRDAGPKPPHDNSNHLPQVQEPHPVCARVERAVGEDISHRLETDVYLLVTDVLAQDRRLVSPTRWRRNTLASDGFAGYGRRAAETHPYLTGVSIVVRTSQEVRVRISMTEDYKPRTRHSRGVNGTLKTRSLP